MHMTMVYKTCQSYDLEYTHQLQHHDFFGRPSAIQQAGFMLVYKDLCKSPLVISDNVKNYLPSLRHVNIKTATEEEVALLKLDALLQKEDITRLYQSLALSARQQHRAQIKVQLKGGGCYYCFSHRCQEHNFFEFIPIAQIEAKAVPHFESFLSKLHGISHELQSYEVQHNPMAHLCQFFVEETQDYTGFECVRLHRFLPDWSSEVLAEAIDQNSDLVLSSSQFYSESYLPFNLRVQCQKMKSWSIFDTGQMPSNLEFVGKGDQVLHRRYTYGMDLTHSLLRAAPDYYVEQLCARGVGCQLVLPLHLKGALWGVLICTSSKARDFNFHLRQQLEVISHQFTQSIQARLEIINARQCFQIELFFKQLSHRQDMNIPVTELLLQNSQWLIDLCDAQGLFMQIGDNKACSGTVPHEKQLSFLQSWLSKAMESGLLYSDSIGTLLPDIPFDYTKVAGFLAVGYQSHKGAPPLTLIWFRRATPREVQQCVNCEIELAHDYSETWSCYHQQAAQTVLHQLCGFLMPYYIEREKACERVNYKLCELEYSAKQMVSHIKQSFCRSQQQKEKSITSKNMSDADALAHLNTLAMEMTLLLEDIQRTFKIGLHNVQVDALNLVDEITEVVDDCNFHNIIAMNIAQSKSSIVFAHKHEFEMVLLILISFIIKTSQQTNALKVDITFENQDKKHIVLRFKTNYRLTPDEIKKLNFFYGTSALSVKSEMEPAMIALVQILKQYGAGLSFKSEESEVIEGSQLLNIYMSYPLDVRDWR
ncbi:MAG: hypothetical protein CMD81_01400 [Gammaproteobacteria bacterium]|nr:hypothetical protein [Gammaproteobacteria bacterium]HBF08469.1 hypothetical protein [Gammaproteobacteria bacterium]